MEARLTIFIAFVCAELIFNAVLIGMIYLIFSKMTSKVTKGMDQCQSSTGPREWLATLQSVSEQAVKVTGAAKEQIAGLEPGLAQMQAGLSESLAKVDVRFKLVCRTVHFAAETVESVVTWPVKNFRMASSVVHGIIDFIRGSESGADASSRRTR